MRRLRSPGVRGGDSEWEECDLERDETLAPKPGTFDEHPTALAARIASKFALESPVEAFDFPDKGNINQHTYLISSGCGSNSREFLLQQINQQVFRRPRNVMAAMIACIKAQRKSLATRPPGESGEWETVELVPTWTGEPFLEFENQRGVSYWRMMKKISDCRTFKSLAEVGSRERQLEVASEAGRGLALYADLTAKVKVTGLENPLPGYRETRLYYRQFHSVMAGNRTFEEAAAFLPKERQLRESTEIHFLVHLPEQEYQRRRQLPEVQRAVDLVLEHEFFATSLLDAMDEGRIRRVAIHGDTKLDNFLFSHRTGKVKALIDLDTIMPHTWLADWGDMVRSLANVAGEKERDLDRVQVDREVFEAIAQGFLATAQSVLPAEVELMVDAVQIISLELGLRFLTDYIRGDSYFILGQTDPPDLNKVRGLSQLTLFERLRERDAELRELIHRHSAERRGGNA